MTKQELIDRAISISTRGLDIPSPNLLTADMVGEDLLVSVFAHVSEDCAGDRHRRSWLRRVNTLTFTNGAATLPEVVLTNYLVESHLLDPAAPSTRYSLQPDFNIFASDYDTRLGSYYVNESSILVVQPGSSYQVGVGLTGALNLLTPSAVEVPADPDDEIDARDEVVESLLDRLVVVLTPILKGRVNAAT